MRPALETETGSGRRRGQGTKSVFHVQFHKFSETRSGREFRSINGITGPIPNLTFTQSNPRRSSPDNHPLRSSLHSVAGVSLCGFVSLPSLRSGYPLGVLCGTCFRSSLRKRITQSHKDTKGEKRIRGSSAVRASASRARKNWCIVLLAKSPKTKSWNEFRISPAQSCQREKSRRSVRLRA